MPELVRQLLDAAPLAVCTADLEGRVTSVSRFPSRSADDGAPSDPADEGAGGGHSLWVLLGDGVSREQVQQAMATLTTGRAGRVAWEFRRGSPEEERVFLAQLTPLRDRHRVTGFVCATADITSSHRSREALIHAGHALARLVDRDRIVQEVGHQLHRLTGAEAAAVVLVADDGAPPEAVFQSGYDEDRSALASRLLALAPGLAGRQEVLVRQAPEGVELVARLLDGDRTVGVVALRLDDTRSLPEVEEARHALATIATQAAVAVERARLARRLGHLRRVEAVGEVASGVAHELRTPLFGISSAAQLLRFRAQDDPVVEKNVGRIMREVERLNRLVTSLLDFGRLTPTTLSPGDPEAVWEEVCDGQRGLIEARALALRRTGPRHPIACAIDREQLAQLFLHLLVNAAEHAPEGSDIGVQSQALPDGGWRLRLTNGGPAIPPDSLPRVFEIFFSTKPGSTGIGLALCQRIAEEHGGTLDITSAAGTGTTVTFSLPALARRR